MTKIFRLFICTVISACLFCGGFSAFAAAELPFDVNAKAALLMDYSSGTILYEKNIDQKLPIASITKVMTLCLVFDEIEAGNLKLSDKITVSENAAGMGGSQAFIDANYAYPVSELVKSIIIASANDSAVAMAEQVAGSEDVFVTKMNEKAAELGMKDTTFKNCTGLPADGHLSTARDVAIMSRELLTHPDYFKWSSTWMDTILHKDNRATGLVNTNKLVRFYDGCDGVKTGYTSESKFCVSASATRGDTRMLAVVLGSETSAIRFAETTKLLNYGFSNFSTVKVVDNSKPLTQTPVLQDGLVKTIEVQPEKNFSLVVGKGQEKQVEYQIILPDAVKAPIVKGQQIGEIIITQNGVEKGRVALIATKDYRQAKYFDYVKKILTDW